MNNLVHCVWATKRRYPFITTANRGQIMRHIIRYAEDNGISIDFINGYMDHIHCLISLQPNQTLAAVIQGLKGESSRWINSHIPECRGFRWAHEYFAVSVGPGILDKVRDYIRDQDIHHKQRSTENELREFYKTIDNYSKRFRWDLIHD